MKKIDISTKTYPNTFALVDDVDYERINSMGKWSVCCSCTSRTLYAVRNGLRMHRVILGELDGPDVDHRDTDGLNNQKHNLRRCTKSENQQNRDAPSNNTSGYKGVGRSGGRWYAGIKVDGQTFRLGYFDIKEDAAEAYNKAALKHHGEFSRLNEIDWTMGGICYERYLSMPRWGVRAYKNEIPIVRSLIKALPTRERIIIKLRFGLDNSREYTLDSISKLLRTSRQRVNQLEIKALSTLNFRLKQAM